MGGLSLHGFAWSDVLKTLRLKSQVVNAQIIAVCQSGKCKEIGSIDDLF